MSGVVSRADAPASPASPDGQAARQLHDSQRLAVEVVLARTQALARSGHLDTAADVLTGTEALHGSGIRPLDLLARIRAQQGRYAEAAALWERVLELEPRSASARAGREAALNMSAPRRRLRFVALVAILPTIVALGVVPLLIGRAHGPRPPVTTRAVAPGALRGAAMASTAPAWTLGRVAGWTTRSSSSSVEVYPQAALFSRGTHLLPRGGRMLDSLAAAVRGISGVEIDIQGLTDPLSVRRGASFRDNEELATRRAAAVAEYLVRTGGLSGDAMRIRRGRPRAASVQERGAMIELTQPAAAGR